MKNYKIIKVQDASLAELDGWRLVGTSEAPHVESLTHEVPGQYGTQWLNKPMLGHQGYLLFERDVTDDELRQRIDELEVKLYAEKDANRAHLENLDTAGKEQFRLKAKVDVLEHSIDYQKAHNESLMASLHNEQQLRRALEADLVKVKNHFGEKAWKEALG